VGSLDFVDIIRHHLDYLATFCYIYNVPPRETRRYWNLYQLRARPYLEHIYTEGSSGKKRFREGTRRVLREIKKDIKEHYNIRCGDTPTVTASLEVPQPSFSTDFFTRLLTEAKKSGIDDPAIHELERLCPVAQSLSDEDEKKKDNESKKDKPVYLREVDVRHIWLTLSKRVTKVGSRVHRTISSQLTSPWTLRSIILNGDSFGSHDRYLVSFETPVETSLGKGRVDIILSERTSLKNETRVCYRPLRIFEIKTKQGHFMTLGRKDIWSESRAHYDLSQRVVADFRFDERALDSDEWEDIIRATPTPNSRTQLNAYSDAVWKEYQKLTGSEEPNPLATGTILVETTADIRLVRNIMRNLVIGIHEEAAKHVDCKNRLVFEPMVHGNSVKVAVVIDKCPQYTSTEGTTLPPDWWPVYDPLQLSSSKENRFILYSDGQSLTSSGASAGWIAKFHHGLQLVKEIVQKDHLLNRIWIDLADQFVDPKLAEARLHLRPYTKKEEDVWRSHNNNIRWLFESISVIGLFKDVERFLFEGKPISSIQKQLEKLPQENCLIVVSGMDTIKDATPEFHRWRLELLLSGILSGLPSHESVTVLWFDSPVPAETYSTPYGCRTLLPFHESSALCGVVNEIVWNLPVASQLDVNPDNWLLPTLTKTPYHDDIRMVVTQNQGGFSIESILVPTLTDWSKRFRAEGLGEVVAEVDVDQKVPDVSVRARMEIISLSLIPWIVKLWPEQKLDAGHGFTSARQRYDQETSKYLTKKEHISLESRALEGEIGDEPTLLQRVRFRPGHVKGGKSFIPVTSNVINSQRLYRRLRVIKTKPKSLIQSPSSIGHKSRIDLADIRFGLTIPSEKLGYEWRSIIDPSSSSPLRIGLFKTGERQSNSGLDWSESRLDIVSMLGQELKRFYDRATEFIFKRNPEFKEDDATRVRQWFAWSRSEGELDWTPIGFHDHVFRSIDSKIGLRAFGVWEDYDVSGLLVQQVEFPTGLKKAILQNIARTSDQLRDVNHVTLKLEALKGACFIRFLNPKSGETVHLLKMTNTADIIRLLRYPMTEGKPLRLQNDLLVTWNPFHDFSYPSPDIDFGKDFEFLEPALISMTTEEGMTLSAAILDTAFERRALQVTIRHYPSQCPLTLSSGSNHASCWGVDPFLEEEFSNLIDTDHYLSDTEVLEGLERVAQTIGSRTLAITFDYGSDEDDRLVFNESHAMRELSRKYREIPLQTFSPGHTVRIKLRKKRQGGKRKPQTFTRGTDVPQ
jgi:hypothetical protein